MRLWYTEIQLPYVKFSIRTDRIIYSGKSNFQQIDIYDSKEFGRILVLDGCTMLTEKDEFIYHEMITHTPMAVLPEAKNILVIGAGDGGVIRELTRYETISSIDLVEIDSLIIEVCKEYLPSVSCCLNNGRVRIHIKDGFEYVKGMENRYDLIIVDSTDPHNFGRELFTKEFYGNCYRALRHNGIMVNQMVNLFYDEDAQAVCKAFICINDTFPISKIYQAHIPTYSSGHSLFGFASKQLHPVHDFNAAKWDSLGIKTRYYNTSLHIGAFALPNYVIELLKV